MTRNAIVILISALLLISCGDGKTAPEQQSLMDASKQELVNALEERDRLLALVKDISNGMDQIKRLENVLTLTNPSAADATTRRAQILSDIASIKQTLKNRREELTALEEQLKQSAFYSEELQSTINVLRTQIDRQSKEIAGLQAQLSSANIQIDSLNNAVDSLNTSMTNVTNELDSAQATSLMLENELNTCYYVVGSKADLREHKIIETAFLRKTRLLKGDFDQNYFVTSDKRSLDSIPLYSRKVKIHTNHPDGSYELTDSEHGKTLRILNHEHFWSLTNYLVIQND